MKNDLDYTERVLKLSREAMDLGHYFTNNNSKKDPSTAQDVSNLLAVFTSGNDVLTEDVANQILKNSEERLKQQKNADNTK